jgi:serine/threonine-protein kinase
VTQPPYEHLPQPGESFAGKYRIGRVLGQGGVGVVFEAYHQRLNQRVAIKILRAEARRSAEWLARFDREARAAVKLRGPNVARVFDVDSTDDGTPYMVMELLEGWNLSEEIGARGPLPITEAVGYVLEACCAMAEAHALGIVHRDLTPANIFLANAGGRRMAKVVDFGISKIRDERTNVTTTDAAFGTPQYVSPEQIRSTAHVDARTDIWALSVILFEALTGTTPFRGDNASAVVASVLMDQPKPLLELRPDLPKGLVAAVMKGLAKNPSERFQTVDELVGAILPYGPQGFMFGASAPLSERPGLLTMGQLPLPQPPLVPSLHGASVSSVPPDFKGGMLADMLSDPTRRIWLMIGAVAVSLLIITALFVGLSGPPQAPSAAATTAAAPAAQPPPAAPVLSAPEPAASPTSASSTSASGSKKKGKTQGSSTPQQPSAPRAAPTVGGDGTPLHL